MFRSAVLAGVGFALASVLGCASPAAKTDDADCVGLPTEQRATDARGTCPNDLPSDTACDGAPSYKTEVANVISDRCGNCHGPGGIEASLPLMTHAQIYAQRRTVLDQIFTCQMPPACALDLTSDERAVLLQWLVCGALDN
jgi:uncharacterized membrane protein